MSTPPIRPSSPVLRYLPKCRENKRKKVCDDHSSQLQPQTDRGQELLKKASVELLRTYERINQRYYAAKAQRKQARQAQERREHLTKAAMENKEYERKLQQWGIKDPVKNSQGKAVKGTYGRVMKCEDSRFVVKLQSPHKAPNPRLCAQVAEKELALAAQIRIWDIPHMAWQDDTAEAPLVRRYAARLENGGSNLYDLYGRQKFASFVDVERIAKQLCEALNGLHAKRILHADLKPENICEENGFVRIIDLGISKNLMGRSGTSSPVFGDLQKPYYKNLQTHQEIFGL